MISAAFGQETVTLPAKPAEPPGGARSRAPRGRPDLGRPGRVLLQGALADPSRPRRRPAGRRRGRAPPVRRRGQVRRQHVPARPGARRAPSDHGLPRPRRRGPGLPGTADEMRRVGPRRQVPPGVQAGRPRLPAPRPLPATACSWPRIRPSPSTRSRSRRATSWTSSGPWRSQAPRAP
ncbi:MAG: hypothetical protein M0C28_47155 [Candidatus Moduliflexus flocculans]|nr:hypothetical protein [Candidatus Moduliflexus flocculans]